MSGTVEIGVKWGKESYQVAVDLSGTGLDLKTQLFSLTGVPPDRIKLMGLKGGKTVADDAALAACGLEDLAAKKKKLMMMGSTAEIIRAPEKAITFVEDLPEEEREAATMKNFSPGLTNLGNTCYMNSCVQCLYAVPEVRDALNAHLTSASAGGGTPASAPAPGGGRALADATRDLFAEMARATQAVTPFRFLALLRQLFPQFAQTGQGGVYAQQDAEECWSQVVQTLSREVPEIDEVFALELEMRLRSEETGEEREETRKELSLKCNITVEVNHLAEGFKVALAEERELRSESAGRDVVFRGQSKITKLPKLLNVHMMRMIWKQATSLDAAGTQGVKTKILRSVAFPLQLDLYPHCSDALKKTLDPARSDKIEKEEIEANARLRADPRAQLNAEVAAGTKEAADKALEAMKKKEEDKDADATGSSGGGSGDAEMTTEADAAAEAKAAEDAKAAANAAKCDGTRQTGFYELVSVLTHKGRSADSGHYVAWVRNGDGTWTEFDDHQPNPKETDQILALKGGGDHHMGYLLMYKAQYI